MKNDHHDVRREYHGGPLNRADLNSDPHLQFSRWLQAALDDNLTDATAMSLATSTTDGRPSVRIVLLKAHSEEGFIFYTDGRSQKGSELTANPQAEVLFHWREQERQVRISGRVSPITREASLAYFDSRPLSSRQSAAASEQSAVISGRDALEAKVAQLGSEFECPVEWGGYCLVAEKFEFWQGRESRLHDRFVYQRQGDRWEIDRLQP